MTRRELAQAELAARWGAQSLMRAAVAEYLHVRDWLPPITTPAEVPPPRHRCSHRVGRCVARSGK